MQIGVIPARFQSVRFPGKPLVKILGVPMVVRTWQQACLCKTLSKVIVATDDDRIAEACRQEGAEVVMTSVSCANGTARPSAEPVYLQGCAAACLIALLTHRAPAGRVCLGRPLGMDRVTAKQHLLSVCRHGEVS